MSSTVFYSPTSLQEALALLDQHREKAVIVNGGTDIVAKIAHGEVDPGAIVYIHDLAELKTIKEENGYVCIGGTVTYASILASPLCQQFSALIQALKELGSPPVRASATPAGNIGTAVPAADCNVAMMALDARFVLARAGGERVIEAKDMFTGYCQTQLEPGELIKEIRIPAKAASSASAFVKLAKRKSQDIAQLSVGVALTMDGDVCKDVRIALGAASAMTVRAYSLEKMLVGKKLATGLTEVKSAVPSETRFRNPRNKPYKEAVIGVVVERAISKAYAELVGGEK